MAKKSRYPFLDFIRGVAVILMIIFHFSYDLNYFGAVSIDFLEDPFWYWFPRIIVFLFLISVGISTAIVHKAGIRWRLVKKRSLKLGILALIISFTTYIIFPKNWIYFGTLHCILASSLAALIFVYKPKLALLFSLIILISNTVFRVIWGHYSVLSLSDWLNVKSLDYIPFYPWFGVVLLGIYLESLRFHQYRAFAWPKSITFLGKHSLVIYLIHQPILFGSCYLARKIFF